MPEMEHSAFSSYPFAVRPLSEQAQIPRYLVYKSMSEFVEVPAGCADEALKAANIVNPFRVVREEAMQRLFLTNEMFG